MTTDTKSNFTVEELNWAGDLFDPQLVDYIVRRSAGINPRLESIANPSVESNQNELRVMFKLERDNQPLHQNLKLVNRVNGICTGLVDIGGLSDPKVLIKLLSSIRKTVGSLKLSTRIRQDLEFSIKEMEATQSRLGSLIKSDFAPTDGRNVIIGIIDFGCDFRHHNFRSNDGSTRILYLWDQSAGGSSKDIRSPKPYNYGREIDKSELDIALRSSDPYQKLLYSPTRGAHGTHVMDIAAGNGRATGVQGLAPQSDIVFVHLNANNQNEVSSFANSANVLDAASYIFAKADRMGLPCVINISLGTWGGPKDGSTLVEQGLDALLEDRNDRSIVVSAGNYKDKRAHTHGRLKDGKASFTWEIKHSDLTDNELQIWYKDSTGSLTVSLSLPNQQQLPSVGTNKVVILKHDGQVLGRMIHRSHDPNNGKNEINILFYNSDPGVRELINRNWTVVLSGSDGIEYDAWIERDIESHRSTISETDATEECTLNSISTGERTISVGAYNIGTPEKPATDYSGRGPSRNSNKIHQPDLIAPGQRLISQGISAASARSQGTMEMLGTSMAAPHITGLIALQMQKSPKNSFDRQLLLDFTDLKQWQPHNGYGKVKADELIRELIPKSERAPKKRKSKFVAEIERVPDQSVPSDSNSDIFVNKITGSGVPDWVAIDKTHEFPWSCICQLRMRWSNGASGIGTGTLIGKDVVLTAAHNLYHKQYGRVETIDVIPGYSSGGGPFGTKQTSAFNYNDDFENDQSLKNDYGIIRLGSSFAGTGFLGMGNLSNSDLSNALLNIAGYSEYGSYGDRLYFHSGGTTSYDQDSIQYNLDTEEGASGAPIFIRINSQIYVIGIHAEGYYSGNKAVRLNQRVYADLTRWI